MPRPANSVGYPLGEAYHSDKDVKKTSLRRAPGRRLRGSATKFAGSKNAQPTMGIHSLAGDLSCGPNALFFRPLFYNRYIRWSRAGPSAASPK